MDSFSCLCCLSRSGPRGKWGTSSTTWSSSTRPPMKSCTRRCPTTNSSPPLWCLRGWRSGDPWPEPPSRNCSTKVWSACSRSVIQVNTACVGCLIRDAVFCSETRYKCIIKTKMYRNFDQFLRHWLTYHKWFIITVHPFKEKRNNQVEEKMFLFMLLFKVTRFYAGLSP